MPCKNKIFAKPLCLIFAVVTLFSAGCHSAIPAAESHTAYTQTKLEAVDHWRDIAIDISLRVQKALGDRPDLMPHPIYIKALPGEGFPPIFGELLKTEIVSRGIMVSMENTPDCLLLEYNLQNAFFRNKRTSPAYTPFANLFTGGRYAEPSNNEVIINTWLSYQSQLVIHSSTVAYINDNERNLYRANSRTVRVVSNKQDTQP